MPADLDAVLVLILFVVPGFIGQRVLGAARARLQPDAQTALLEALVFSCVNFAAFGWLLLAVPELDRRFVEDHLAFVIAAWIVFLVLAPAWWGLLAAWALERGWLGRAYGFFRLRPIEPTATPWDHRFRQGRQGLLRVTLADGTVVAGFFGLDSRAAAHPAREDLYLERQYGVDADGRLSPKPLPHSEGVWIRGDQVQVVEFLSFAAGGPDADGATPREAGAAGEPALATDATGATQAGRLPAGGTQAGPGEGDGPRAGYGHPQAQAQAVATGAERQ